MTTEPSNERMLAEAEQISSRARARPSLYARQHYENKRNLAPPSLSRSSDATRARAWGPQELNADVLDVHGALWDRAWIDASQSKRPRAPMRRRRDRPGGDLGEDTRCPISN